MGFLRFLWGEHVLKWALLAFVLLDGWGRVSAAREIYSVLPHWVWEPVGLSAFAGGILWTLYKWHLQLQTQWERMRALPMQPDKPVNDARTNAILRLHGAMVDAGFALTGAPNITSSRRTLASLRAELMTAHNVFGIPMPSEDGSSLVQAKNAREYIAEILPYLRRGHVEEAIKLAERYI